MYEEDYDYCEPSQDELDEYGYDPRDYDDDELYAQQSDECDYGGYCRDEGYHVDEFFDDAY